MVPADSNTEPILVMRAEAKDIEGLSKIKKDVEKRLGSIIDLQNSSSLGYNLQSFHNFENIADNCST